MIGSIHRYYITIIFPIAKEGMCEKLLEYISIFNHDISLFTYLVSKVMYRVTYYIYSYYITPSPFKEKFECK